MKTFKKKTNEEYINELLIKNPNVYAIDEYINSYTKIQHLCKNCGYKWNAMPKDVLRGSGCPKCAGLKRTHQEYIDKLLSINDNIIVIGEYKNSITKILHECKKCGHRWMSKPTDILHGYGCPVCGHRIVGNPPKYLNSIWASKYKKIAEQYGITESQMKSTMLNSGKKIEVKCKNCGYSKLMRVCDVFRIGFTCDKCFDGISYSEKFMMSVLEQLQINYETQYSPNWIGRKRYDFYLPDYNCIIETNGRQHYIQKGFSSVGGRSLDEEILNDSFKKDKAKQNGIENYIVIDCSYSNLEWVKSQIMKSNLPKLLHFTENLINWERCEQSTLSNRTKIAANLWNNGMSIKDISKQINSNTTTAISVLKKASNCGLCDYKPGDGQIRSVKFGKTHPNSKSVLQCDDNGNIIKIWDNITIASKKLGINISSIISCCKGKLKHAGGYCWMYK